MYELCVLFGVGVGWYKELPGTQDLPEWLLQMVADIHQNAPVM